MGRRYSLLLGCTLIVASAVADAATITFAEVAATNDGTPFAGTIAGATFSGTNAGIWAGNSNGDPGLWGLEGTNGPHFLGFNGGAGGSDPLYYSEVVTFDVPVSSVSIDFARATGSVDGSVTLQAFDSSGSIGFVTGELGSVNAWSTLSVAFPDMTSIAWNVMGTGSHPYGVDNLDYSPVPIPAVGWFILPAFGGFGWFGRRRLPKRA